MVRTPWLLATLLFASVMILLIMGPIEVLIPFVIKNRAGGDPGDHAVVMAAFGIGGAIGSLGMASLRMPRRYLTTMLLSWGAGSLPLAVMGLATDVAVIAVASFVLGVFFSAPMVIWARCCSAASRRGCSGGCPAWTSSARWCSCRCRWRSSARSATPSGWPPRS
jgi:MFS family permease